MRCSSCRHANPQPARFCGQCGKPLAPVRSKPTAGATKTLVLLGLALVGGALAFSALSRVAHESRARRLARSATNLTQAFDLDGELTDELRALLAPDDIQVRVNPSGRHLQVSGSDRELAVVARFIAMAESDRGRQVVRRSKIPASWEGLDVALVEMRRSRARRVERLLSKSSAPIIVEVVHEGLRVHGAPQDIELIRELGCILRGERLTDGRTQGFPWTDSCPNARENVRW